LLQPLSYCFSQASPVHLLYRRLQLTLVIEGDTDWMNSGNH